MSPDKLYVVCALSNPLRFKSRWALYERFIAHMMKSGVHLTTVELTYGERHSEALPINDRVCEKHIDTHDPNHTIIRLTSKDQIWSKENLLSIGASLLPECWKYVAFLDSDIEFMHPNWAANIVEQLQHYDIVQPWSHAVDLDSKFQMIQPFKPATSFFYAHHHNLESSSGRYDDHNWHTGYGLCFTKKAFQQLGLIQICALGSGDRSMCTALIGKAHLSYHKDVTESYKQHILAWQDLADAYIQGNVGFCEGLIVHGFHGPKVNRGYQSRWSILVKNKYDPVTDIKFDMTQHGLMEFSHFKTERMRSLRDDIRRYFLSRREDDNS